MRVGLPGLWEDSRADRGRTAALPTGQAEPPLLAPADASPTLGSADTSVFFSSNRQHPDLCRSALLGAQGCSPLGRSPGLSPPTPDHPEDPGLPAPLLSSPPTGTCCRLFCLLPPGPAHRRRFLQI
ncbi:unnamed protein product [Rangifer tarandus platyrhynchus]|uniref:Uncharacterized protein n=1 Tax=Rangifer tarandus platyrhynchus TaxID=3082113 RepID=A0AC59YQC8_RANTA